jgi:hypothetical protein
MKKLIGKKEMEDALKRLDKLTQEEARMAAAEILRLTHIVDKKVTIVDDKVAIVDDKVAIVDDKVTTVVDKVTTVDDKVTTVINGKWHVKNSGYLVLNARTLVRRQRNKASRTANGKHRRRHKMFVIHHVDSASDHPNVARRGPSEREPEKMGHSARSVNKSHHRLRYPTRWIRSVVLSR